MSEKFEELLKNYDNCTPSASGTRAALVEYVTELETKVEQRTSALQYANQNVADFFHQIKDLQEENARLREAARWIPVSERLPEEGVAVIVKYESGYAIAFYKDGVWRRYSNWWIDGITLWRTLQPPEVE